MFGFGRKNDAQKDDAQKNDARQDAAPQETLEAPFPGSLVQLQDVPDPVFSQRMLGDGFAVEPAPDAGALQVRAPIAGRIVKVFGTGHAFAMVSDGGLEVMVHVGLDTVELKGEGFEALIEAGAQVTAGEPVLRADIAAIRAGGRSPVTPVVCTKGAQVAELEVRAGADGPCAVVTRA